MKKTILTILGSALIAASVGQAASATEHGAIHKAHRAPVAASEQFRNSNAYAAPSVSAQPGWSRYENGVEFGTRRSLNRRARIGSRRAERAGLFCWQLTET